MYINKNNYNDNYSYRDILKICDQVLINTLPSTLLTAFAAMHMTQEIVNSTSWKFPHAAFKDLTNNTRITNVLGPVFNNSFTSSPSYRFLFDIVYSAFSPIGIREFVAAYIPYYFTHFSRCLDVLDSLHLEFEEKCLALVQAKADWMSSSATEPCSGKSVRHLFSEDEWTTLLFAANCYACDFQTKVGAAAHEAHVILNEAKFPAEFQIALYGQVRELMGKWTGRQVDWTKHMDINNVSHLLRWRQNLKPKLDPFSFDGPINRAAIALGRIRRPIDFLRSVLVNEENDDSKIEVGFVLPMFTAAILPSDVILVINPSPDFIAQYPNEVLNRTTFAVPYESMAWVLSHEFPSSKFLTIDEYLTASKNGPFETEEYIFYTKTLLFDRSLAPNILHSLIESIVNSYDIYFALVPEKCFFESFPSHRGHHISLFPTNAFNSEPKRKVFVRKLTDTTSTTFVTKYDFITNNSIRYLKKDIEHPVDIEWSPVLRKSSLHETYKKRLLAPATTKRNSPGSVFFSKDLTFWYTSEERDYSNICIKAYVSYLPTKSQLKRNIFPRGKKIKGATSFKSGFYSQKEALTWVECTMPFQKQIHQGVLTAFSKPEGIELLSSGNICLKTFWYLQLPTGADGAVITPSATEIDLFYSHIGTMPLNASREEYERELHLFYRIHSEHSPIQYWNLLNQLFNKAVANKYIPENPISSLRQEVFSKTDTSAFRAVRAALTKKTFRLDEMTALLQYLIPSIDENWSLVSVLIRLFTALEPNVISALTWEDYRSISRVGIRQFWIYRQCRNSNIQYPVPLVNSEDFRRIPIIKTLDILLSRRYNEITRLPEDQNKDFKKWQIISPDFSPGFTISPRQVGIYSRDAVRAIGIPDNIVSLPHPDDIDGTKETNLSVYKGDIFRSNFHHYVNHICGFIDEESRYILGMKQVTPFGNNYCDFTNPLSQFTIYKKMQIWEQALNFASPLPTEFPVISPFTFSVPEGNDAFLEVEFDKHASDFVLHAMCDSGLNMQANLIPTHQDNPETG